MLKVWVIVESPEEDAFLSKVLYKKEDCIAYFESKLTHAFTEEMFVENDNMRIDDENGTRLAARLMRVS